MDSATRTQVIALKFAERAGLPRRSFFYGQGGAEGTVDIDYLFWLVRTPMAAYLVDTGFSPPVAVRRRHERYLRTPLEALAAVDASPAELAGVILTHLHYDHAGGLRDLPPLDVWLQRAEYEFWTRPRGDYPEADRHVETADIDVVRDLEATGHLHLLDGDRELGDGVSTHLIGGHTPGNQAVRIETAAGPLVLACDAAHLRENFDARLPIGVFTDLPAVYDGYERLLELAGGDPTRVIPGHDPAVIAGSPPVAGLAGIAATLA